MVFRNQLSRWLTSPPEASLFICFFVRPHIGHEQSEYIEPRTKNDEPRTFLLIHEQRTCHDVVLLCFMAITFKLVIIRDM